VISRAQNPIRNAYELGKICGCSPRAAIETPWNDEFGLIDKLLRLAPVANTAESTPVRIAPGDDACLLYPVTNPVITTDTQKEGVHFILDWQTPEEVGFKAVVITLSDLAACYATPVSLFINLGLPPHVSDRTVEAMYRGIQTALDTYRCALGGGNISRARQLSIDLFAIGQGKDDLFPRRAAANPGDGLYCTGPLGLARAGLQCLLKKDTAFETLIDKFKSPMARFDAAEILFENRVSCVMDISDGLAGDANHIAKASGISIEFDLQAADVDPALISYSEKYHLSPEETVLAGGEDYELLFACPPETFDAVKRRLPGAFQVGRCLPFNGNHLVNLPAGISSYQHGR
jgi:thiamine-monophosphate kinase